MNRESSTVREAIKTRAPVAMGVDAETASVTFPDLSIHAIRPHWLEALEYGPKPVDESTASLDQPLTTPKRRKLSNKAAGTVLSGLFNAVQNYKTKKGDTSITAHKIRFSINHQYTTWYLYNKRALQIRSMLARCSQCSGGGVCNCK